VYSIRLASPDCSEMVPSSPGCFLRVPSAVVLRLFASCAAVIVVAVVLGLLILGLWSAPPEHLVQSTQTCSHGLKN